MLLAAVAAAAVAAFVLLQPDGSEVVVEPQRAEAITGQLGTTVQLTGSAAAARSATLTFEVAGVVAAVEVEMGHAVVVGDALATLDDAGAQRRVRTAEVQFEQARLRLDDLLADPAASDIAAARQSVESAESQVLSAETALVRLLEPAGAADVASAEQAVANTRAQHSSAEDALARLLEPASTADVASAEQAVANTRAQHSSAEEALAALLAGPTGEEIASAESSVTEAHAHLSSALSREDASWDALIASFDEYCGRYDHLNDVAETTCSADLPFSDDEVAALRDSIEDRSTTYQRYADALIDAHVAFIEAAAARASAVTGLGSADARLAELRSPVSADDRYQAEQAVEAAQASHAAAVARLDDLRAPPDPAEVEHTRSSVDSARAGLVTAQARLDELMTGATANAITQQELSVRLAEISLEEARAALDGLAVYAPFDGVVEAVNVQPGDRVAANLAAFSLSTSTSIVIDLTVTEADLLDLAVGQPGLASFDAVEGVEYPVRIASISRVPNAAQGVVTYDVQARLLAGPEIAEVASEIAALGDGATLDVAGLGALAAGFGGGAGTTGTTDGRGGLRGGAGGATGGAAGGAAGLLTGLELPEGVTDPAGAAGGG